MEILLQGMAMGVIAGFLAGMFGVGGSTILTPLLRTILGLDPLIALATPLPVVIPTAISGAAAYWRHNLIDFRTALLTAAAGIPATIAGAYATSFLSGQFLMLLTAVAIGLIGLDMAFGFSSRRGDSPQRETCGAASTGVVLPTGVFAGFLAGLLAVGGGFILVPAYYRLLHLDIKRSIATSLAAVLLLAIPGSIVHILLGHVDLELALGLALGAVPMAYAGAQVAVRLESATLKKLFAAALIIFAAYFFYSQL